MKMTAISNAAREVAVSGMSINTSNDGVTLSALTETWDELNELKNTIAHGILQFVGQIEEITGHEQIVANLGVYRQEFDRLLNVFYTDLDGFTRKIQELRAEHETRTGRIQSMDDLNIYNRLAMEYQALNSQLMTLLAPTITSLVIVVNDTVPTQQPATAPVGNMPNEQQ